MAHHGADDRGMDRQRVQQLSIVEKATGKWIRIGQNVAVQMTTLTTGRSTKVLPVLRQVHYSGMTSDLGKRIYGYRI